MTMRKGGGLLSTVALVGVSFAMTLAEPAAQAHAATNHPTNHLASALELAGNLNSIGWDGGQDTYNSYSTAGEVKWGTPGEGTTYRAHTQCAPFVTQVLKHAYPWATDTYFRQNFGSTSPYAEQYQKAIAKDSTQNFDRVTDVAAIRAGDIIAVDYDPTASTSPSGHVMIATGSSAGEDNTDTDPGTTEYVFPVVDSTSSRHGTDTQYPDTRAAGKGGAGTGYIVLVADSTGTIVGHRWSPTDNTVRTTEEQPLAVGRVTQDDTSVAQLLGNPGFESGATDWTTSSLKGNAALAHTGTNFIQMPWQNDPLPAQPYLTETRHVPVTIPTGSAARLSFWARVTTSEPVGNGPVDTMRIQVIEKNGTVHELGRLTNLSANNGYAQFTYDLSALPLTSSEVSINFRTALNSSYRTNFLLDDTALHAD
ncbi:hypothetical protein ACFY5C_10215 [Streptomyces sp. NPDC012935]|uniref:hypothetical protein n=1 Tax=Streptomyces sp. NPDC012935 TaxID=3364857 RepID=UPI0036806979